MKSFNPIPIATAAVIAATLILTGCASPRSKASMTPKRVLVVTTTTGFRHSSIPTAEKIIGELAKSSGAFTVDYARVDPDDAQFKGENGRLDRQKYNAAVKAVLTEKMSLEALKNYDGVIFANTTGDLPMPDPQGFLDWIKAGHAFVGIHSATDTFAGFHPYTEMVGAHFLQHGLQVEVEVINQDAECAACKPIGKTWTVFEEVYQFKEFDRAKVHGLLTLDKHPNNKTPGDYPVSWSKDYGTGRMFYTSFGHREDLWDPERTERDGRKNSPEVAKQFQQHVLGGIRWALGLEK